MNKRTFLRTLGLFSILPGAGRVWKAVRAEPQRPPQLVAYWHQTRCAGHYVTEEYSQAFFESFFYGKPIPPHLLPPPEVEPIVLGQNLGIIGVRPA